MPEPIAIWLGFTPDQVEQMDEFELYRIQWFYAGVARAYSREARYEESARYAAMRDAAAEERSRRYVTSALAALERLQTDRAADEERLSPDRLAAVSVAHDLAEHGEGGACDGD